MRRIIPTMQTWIAGTRGIPPVVLLAFAAGVLALSPAARMVAAEPVPERFLRQLQAGEFAPARRSATELPRGTTRDVMLQQLALAQVRCGARNASLVSAAEIDGDLARAAVLSAIEAASGGGAQADFDALIELIETTVAPDTWESVGGAGTIREFEAGVRVDAQGLLRLRPPREGIAAERERFREIPGGNDDARRCSPLRKVSLPRLERHVQMQLARGRPLEEEVLLLAGLETIEFVVIDPAEGDLIIAGPAGDWTHDGEGRVVSRKSARPLLRLDDLVLILRITLDRSDPVFGCSIDPTPEGLASIVDYVARMRGRSLRPGERGSWLQGLRDALGRQEIRVFGIPADSRIALVLIEADYRMKLLGMGLEPTIPEVPNYLSRLQVDGADAPPPIDVLRWWFTLKPDPIDVDAGRQCFRLTGTGVRLQSENEMLAEQGRRLPTGAAEPANRAFASDFTEHFEALSRKYPVYADLMNIFRLATVAALIRSEEMNDKVGWHVTCFRRESSYPLPRLESPRWVESVVNWRRTGGRSIVAGVSGGVRVDPAHLPTQIREVGKLEFPGPRAARSTRAAWWWD